MRLLLVALALLMHSHPAIAGLVTITFEGVVQATEPVYFQTELLYSATPADDLDLLPAIVPGDRFSGSFSFDDGLAFDQDPAPDTAEYPVRFFPSTVAVRINGFEFLSQPTVQPDEGKILIRDGAPFDAWGFFWAEVKRSPYPGAHDVLNEFGVQAQGSDNDPSRADFLSSTALSDIPNFSAADAIQFSFTAKQTYASGSGGVFIVGNRWSTFRGAISSMTTVPESRAALHCFALGLLGLWRERRARRRGMAGSPTR